MTITQRKQLAAVLLKEGEDGWRVLVRHRSESVGWFVMPSDHDVDMDNFLYRAVRVEKTPKRTPLPIEHYKMGMEVLVGCDVNPWLVLRVAANGTHLVLLLGDDYAHHVKASNVTNWRWSNETEWKPAFTETVKEREVERLEVGE